VATHSRDFPDPQEQKRRGAKLLEKYLNEVNELLPLCESDGVVFIADIPLLVAMAGQDAVRSLLAWRWEMPVQSSEVQGLLDLWGNESRPLVFASPFGVAKDLIETITPDIEGLNIAESHKQPDHRLVAVISNNAICYCQLPYRPFAEDGQHRITSIC